MKKLLAFGLLCYSLGNAQCINGPSTITAGTNATFTSAVAAQCSDCYDWDINGDPNATANSTVGNIKISGSDTGSSVTISALGVGPFSIELTYFDETGCHECTFNGNVVGGATPMPKFSCFGFDPASPLTTDPYLGTLNEFFISGTGLGASGLSYQWFWIYADYTPGSAYGLNAQVWEKCPDNPIISFGVIITNGTTTNKYYSGPATGPYHIPGFGSASARTCFLHPDCDPMDGYRTGAIKESKSTIVPVPNPTKGIVTLQGENTEGYTVTVFDSKGKTIIGKQALDTQIDLSKYPVDVYPYKVYDKDGRFVEEGKILKN
ncbi:T9SS type A sorting domain-containing protein [Flavobacterium sp. MAH-1]|uniref:T9SS type A sorting domain-containing protein n=1 Tax=Flavobacterium agri TaxID=2743471 RepID=A0A7Y9C4G8_9FLAO|nr:T9SS type A sorting domain-containing protein [Flavobacterium agri]NUY79280.1 T9SS type A sorting domain-containing protein [Flavobacterium agri]NYA69304.1 T9SS type A sorting domain-containing protein [Flavobacterium agri]